MRSRAVGPGGARNAKPQNEDTYDDDDEFFCRLVEFVSQPLHLALQLFFEVSLLALPVEPLALHFFAHVVAIDSGHQIAEIAVFILLCCVGASGVQCWLLRHEVQLFYQNTPKFKTSALYRYDVR